MKKIMLFPLPMALLSASANAAIDNNGVLDDVTIRFMEASSTWATVITNYASNLFWSLGTISLVWTGGTLLLKQADIREFFAEFVRFIITFGFFLWLLRNGPAIATSIIDSLRMIGAEASGLSRELTPSEPISIAFDILVKSSHSLSFTSPFDSLAIFIITLLILACMAVVSANVLLTLVSAWVLCYGGIFVLGFGSSRWTSDIAINYFRSVLGLALKLMTMTLLLGVAMSIMDNFYTALSDEAPMRELLVVFVVSLVLVLLIHSVPNIVAGLVPGSGASASTGNFSVGAMTGAAIATGGMAAGAIASAAGGSSAIQAAFKAASSEVTSSMTGSIGDDNSNFQDSDSESDNGQSAYAKAAGFDTDLDHFRGYAAKAGRIAAGTGKNLAQGIGEIAKSRINQTAGGRLAETIKNRTGQEDD